MTPEEVKNRSRGVSTDMSSEAISRRLDIASEMFDLVNDLQKAKRMEPLEEGVAEAPQVDGKDLKKE